MPFLDIDVVNFAARVPVTYKQCGPVGKWVLKKAMEPYLPHDVIYRPKSSVGAPLRRWMRHDLRELLGDWSAGRAGQAGRARGVGGAAADCGQR